MSYIRFRVSWAVTHTWHIVDFELFTATERSCRTCFLSQLAALSCPIKQECSKSPKSQLSINDPFIVSCFFFAHNRGKAYVWISNRLLLTSMSSLKQLITGSEVMMLRRPIKESKWRGVISIKCVLLDREQSCYSTVKHVFVSRASCHVISSSTKETFHL